MPDLMFIQFPFQPQPVNCKRVALQQYIAKNAGRSFQEKSVYISYLCLGSTYSIFLLCMLIRYVLTWEAGLQFNRHHHRPSSWRPSPFASRIGKVPWSLCEASSVTWAFPWPATSQPASLPSISCTLPAEKGG